MMLIDTFTLIVTKNTEKVDQYTGDGKQTENKKKLTQEKTTMQLRQRLKVKRVKNVKPQIPTPQTDIFILLFFFIFFIPTPAYHFS